ncbi:thioredoxin-disulfide reductase [Thermaerobacter sp. PB12/4term]|uniref:thioredoxin-disulfide reductase n=1 Tax=Thermaerobacter sp. PB12/4term TaxID=2293838 RepID=UPI000E325A4F|nr:thioredoxin-disulfide reductase [Thermaerobacter sp. PB12/4term]QIA26183.1 thioredoxin-disulfide reductase [Thermaerobacter sp. PB12/4term]
MSSQRVVIVGSGPAGLTAAIYAARANLDTTVVAGWEAGGQLMLTTEVENFPGFPEGILGPDLMARMRQQAERAGARFVDGDVTGVDFSRRPFRLQVGSTELEADAVILATGASAKWLGLPSEKRLMGRGVSSCATCDGAFFRDQDVVVVGGGDTAMEEALYLARICRSVTVVHRRDRLRASKIMQERAMANDKIRFVWDSVVEDILGEEKVEGVRVRNVKTGQTSEIPCAAVFVAIGHKPNTDFLRGHLDLDERGYVIADGPRTSIPGVFVAGDVRDHRYRQAVTAAAEGCKAAMEAAWFLEGTSDVVPPAGAVPAAQGQDAASTGGR